MPTHGEITFHLHNVPVQVAYIRDREGVAITCCKYPGKDVLDELMADEHDDVLQTCMEDAE